MSLTRNALKHRKPALRILFFTIAPWLLGIWALATLATDFLDYHFISKSERESALKMQREILFGTPMEAAKPSIKLPEPDALVSEITLRTAIGNGCIKEKLAKSLEADKPITNRRLDLANKRCTWVSSNI